MIKVENLTYSYPGSNISAVNEISFSIEKGEIFGFLGPSGSGKSTTQKILIKLLHGFKGNVSILGKELSDWDQSLYKHLGVGFELPNHYLKLTALENLKFFAAFYDKTLDPLELLERVGLRKDANKKVSDFSKGMKMRLNFVRAMLHDPDILFLDEPTSGLDPVNAHIIKDIILDLRSKGKTIFITTHQMHDAEELCDRVAFIVNGSIKAMDSPSALKIQYSGKALDVQFEGLENIQSYDLKTLGQNSEFLDAIRKFEIVTMHSTEASLDKVFIEITGKKLNE